MRVCFAGPAEWRGGEMWGGELGSCERRFLLERGSGFPMKLFFVGGGDGSGFALRSYAGFLIVASFRRAGAQNSAGPAPCFYHAASRQPLQRRTLVVVAMVVCMVTGRDVAAIGGAFFHVQYFKF